MRRLIGLTACLLALATTARAAGYADVLTKATEALGHAAKAGKLVPAGAFAEAHEPTAAEKKAGLVVFAPPLSRTFADRMPAAGSVTKAVSIRAARGEIESALVAVHALKDFKGLRLTADGPMPAGVSVRIIEVVMGPVAQGKSGSYHIEGLWLAEGGEVDVKAGQSRAWLVRVTVSADAKPGDYALVRSFSDASGRTVAAAPKVNIKVLPFELADAWQHKYVFGAFTGGADFTEAEYRQMKAHGIEAIQWFWGHYGMEVTKVDGKLKMDFKDLDRTVAAFIKAGMRGPIVLALGNDQAGHFERAICREFNLPMQPQVKRDKKVIKMATLDEPRTEALMVEGLRQLFTHAKAKKYPEIVILPYDEPTERLMKEHRRMVGLLRKNFPEVRLYGVTMNRLKWAQMVSDTDILVGNGDFARICKFAAEKNKDVWLYGGATTKHGYAGVRWRYGLRTFSYRPDGSWFWSYNYHPGDAWNDFDSHTPDSQWVIRWPRLSPDGGCVETLAFEGTREAVDDVRYALTLDDALTGAHCAPNKDTIRTAYDKWLEDLQKARPKSSELPKLREQLVEWILQAKCP